MQKRGVLLLNLGTPNSPAVKDVRKYLREFLMDKYVIDMPYITRWLLVNLIIAPFRAPKSAKNYQQLWTKNGSPLKYFGEQVRQLLQEKLATNYTVFFAMRYQNPSISTVLKQIKTYNINDLLVIPMYPQYASSTTKSSIEKVKKELKKINFNPTIQFIENFITNKKFINVFAQLGLSYWNTNKFDKVIFSFHGVPERHILKDCDTGFCQLNENCCSVYSAKNKRCYRAQCFETARLIAKKMNLNPGDYVVVFQSRLETRNRDPWLKPYADLIIADLPQQNIKNVLIFSLSFVADCLETTLEVGTEFKNLFLSKGGEKFQLVQSLNNHPLWIETLEDLIINN